MRNSKFNPVIILVTLAILVVPFQVVHADAGPKFFPFTFDFFYDTTTIEIKSATLLTCSNVDCQTPTSSNELRCFRAECVSYFSPPEAPYYKIEVEFSDIKRTSNVFSQVRLSADYTVRFNQDGLAVQEVFHPGFASESLLWLFFIPALMITIVTEKAVSGLFSRLWSVRLTWVARVNVISLPIVWFIFPMLPLPLRWVWLFAEFFVILFEAAFLAFANRVYHLSIAKFLALSTVLNISSILAGIIVPTILLFFLWINQECITSTACNWNDYLRWLSGFASWIDYIR